MQAARINETGLRQDERLERLKLFGLSSPALLLILVILVLPVGWLFYVSFVGANGEFSLENYERMINRKSYARIFMTTFQISFLTTGLCILIGYPLAYFLSQLPPRLANLGLITVLLPFWTSLLVRTYAWLVLLQKRGLVNEWAISLGLWEEPIKIVHNMTGTLIGMVHIMLPFLILPVYGAMRSIDLDLMKAASNLGANPRRAFWNVFFPLTMPGLMAGSLMVFILFLLLKIDRQGQSTSTNDDVCQFADGDLVRVADVYRREPRIRVVHQTDHAFQQIIDIAEAAGLRTIAIDRDGFVP